MKYNFRVWQPQEYITDDTYPYFIIYRDDAFDEVAKKLQFGVFDVFRDRQITKKNSTQIMQPGYIRVLKARNIQDDGTILDIEGYDTFIDPEICRTLSVSQYLDNDTVYLTPNMTYNPRVIPNNNRCVPDGSVAVLIPKKPLTLTSAQMKYFTTAEYRRFYLTARNLSTQSINVDSKSVFFYGVIKND